VSDQLHVLAALAQGKGSWHPFCRRLGGCWNHSGCGGKENWDSLDV